VWKQTIMMSRSQVIASVTSHRQQLMQYVILIVSYLAKKSIVSVVDKFSHRQLISSYRKLARVKGRN